MEHHKTSKLLNNWTISKFVTSKSIEGNCLLNGQYSVNENTRLETAMLRSDFSDYSDSCIVVRGTITSAGTNSDNRRSEKLAFNNNAPFCSCISKINNTFMENAEDCNIVMLMNNLLEYSDNYSFFFFFSFSICTWDIM